MLVAAYALLASFPRPLFPAPGLESSWVVAAEHAARSGAVFGRDFVFTYGPLAFLSTKLFAADTFAWALAFDALVALIWLSPLLLSRHAAVIALYLIAAVLQPSFDARIVAALFALVVVGASRPGWWVVAVAAAFAPLALSKLSFALAALPMLLLLDGYYLFGLKRVPLATIAFLLVFAAALLATGQPVAAWPGAAYLDGQVIAGYSSAMQLAIRLGGVAVLVAALVLLASLTATAAVALWRRRDTGSIGLGRHLTVLLTLLWSIYIGFKMGYVRADGHIVITWQLAVFLLPVLLAYLAAVAPPTRAEGAAMLVLAIVSSMAIVAFGYKFADPRPPLASYLAERVDTALLQPWRSLAWAAPSRWRAAAAQRRAADEALVRRFPPSVVGRVDSIPIELTPIIPSGLDYRPRPVPQSYSSYTPALQRADAAFLADSSRAPHTLFLTMGYDVDYRLPTLATGPSLPIIARWYDLAGTDPLGLILHRRSTPRAVVRSNGGARRFTLGEWVPLPSAAGDRMVVGAIAMDRTALAGAMGLVAREPSLSIDIRYATGATRTFRFVPGMAALGVVLSPMMLDADVALRNLRGTAGVVFPGSQPAAAPAVSAFRITGDPTARYGFRGGAVRFERLAIAR